MSGAFFGRPQAQPVPGGMHVTVHLVPVSEGRLVVFDVTAAEARGRWLPWTTMPFGGNPWEVAATLADDWLDGAIDDISLVDVLSLSLSGSGWELAIVFRARLTALPPAEPARHRAPYVFPTGAFDAIGSFDPVDLERWVAAGPAAAPGTGAPPEPGLLF
ncbi:MAG: hypothetical protein IT303_05150 [Dehalococcoidia bacterium]|nr:hypothetical protein [Dehalococcoidia bacterium]